MKWGIIGKAAALQKEPGGRVTAKTDYLKNKIKQNPPNKQTTPPTITRVNMQVFQRVLTTLFYLYYVK